MMVYPFDCGLKDVLEQGKTDSYLFIAPEIID